MDIHQHLVSEDGEFSLMLFRQRACGPIYAFVVPSWQADIDRLVNYDGFAFTMVPDEDAAVEWFADVSLNRPWETRQ
jgi:hypothetical protein